jgi:hypothetical protein
MILTTGIHQVFRGLKFEPNAAIGEIGGFWSRTIVISVCQEVGESG